MMAGTGMRRNNKWNHGKVVLHLAPPPPQYHGATGCVLLEATWDDEVGPEVYLVILEAGKFSDEVARTRPFELFCTLGLGRTDSGMVVFLVWLVRDGSKRVAWYEQFLDPHLTDTARLLSAWAQQTHFKAVVMDSLSGEIKDWFELENNFGVERLAASLAQCVAHEAEGDFQLAQQQFMEEHPIEELMGEG